MRHGLTRSTFVLITTLALAACGGDEGDGDCEGPTCPGGDDDLGTMSATVTGDVSESFSGEGFFIADDVDNSWGFYLGDDDENASAIWFWGEGGRPGTGTRTLTLDGTTGGWYVHGGTGAFYWAESGTVSITTSSASRMVGSFDFTGTDMNGGEVSIEGTFNVPNWTDQLN